jgi:hypothetical protein
VTTYSGFIIGPKMKKSEITRLSALVQELERFDWHHGTVIQRRFIGRSFWTKDGDKLVRSEPSWFKWIEDEERKGFDFMKLPTPKQTPLVASLSAGGRLTIWDGIHRIAFCIANNVDPMHVRIGMERC